MTDRALFLVRRAEGFDDCAPLGLVVESTILDFPSGATMRMCGKVDDVEVVGEGI
jgi:hypothetical protein